jgi:RNA polymerase sigma factor (sigma-70 family)
VREPRGFLVRISKNIVIDRMRRDAIVNIEAMANLDELEIADSAPSPERVALARAELRWVIGLIANLPDRCKEVFRARRIYGLSQIETAETLGISEGIVEKETMRGMALISDMIAQVGVHDDLRVRAHIQSAVKKNHVND